MIVETDAVMLGSGQIGRMLDWVGDAMCTVIAAAGTQCAWRDEIIRRGVGAQFTLVTPRYVRKWGIPGGISSVIADQVLSGGGPTLLLLLCRTPRSVWVRGVIHTTKGAS